MEQQVIENKEAKEKKITPLFVLKIVGNVFFYFIIIILLLLSIMNIRAGKQNESFPNIFGKGFLSVQTNSMNGDKEDSFKAGDLLFVKVFKEKKANDLKVNDIITFYDSTVNDNQGGLNSHRIVYINYDKDGNVASVVCQGDKSAMDYNWTFNPESTDSNAPIRNQELLSGNHAQTVSLKDIKGVMTSIWHGAGKTVDGIQKNWLFIFVLPVLAFLIFEIFMVAKNVMALKNEKKGINNDNVIDLEAQKEELRAQILAELRAEQGLKEPEVAPKEESQEEDTLEKEATPEDAAPSEEIHEEQPEDDAVEERPSAEEESNKEPVEEKVLEATPEDKEEVLEAEQSEITLEEPEAAPEEPIQPEEVSEEPKEEKPVKKTTAKKATSTVAKKPAAAKTSTTKKTTSTAAKKPTAAKTSTTKKTTSTAAKKPTAAKTSTTKKTTSTTAKKPAAAKASTTKKTTSTGAKKTTTKKTNTGAKKESGE